MKSVYIFVEGPNDAEFLRRILPAELLTDAEVVTVDKGSGMPSLASSVLLRRKKPILVVMDADSLNPNLIEERQASTEELIRMANSSIPVKVVVAVPAMEAWLFAAPEAIGRALGQAVPSEFVPLGKRDPSGVLQHLAERNKTKWDFRRVLDLLDAHDIDRIRALPEVSDLCSFLKSVHKDDKAA